MKYTVRKQKELRKSKEFGLPPDVGGVAPNGVALLVGVSDDVSSLSVDVGVDGLDSRVDLVGQELFGLSYSGLDVGAFLSDSLPERGDDRVRRGGCRLAEDGSFK